MRIYNTLTRRVEEIVPIEAGRIKMYSCGPTVYRYIHIGNLRTFTMADWIRRTFEYRGCEVLHVKNITDVGHMRQEMVDRGEDKILAQARKEGKTSLQIAQFYTDAFHADEAKLNILPAKIFPRATQHIPEMIAIIQGLQAKGIAYEAHGNVYYDIKRFPTYGKLSGNQLENMLAGVREGVDADRHNSEDFPLWKVAEPGREMAWDSPWGRGFPGWHIECSAMSMKYLGEHFDLHTGGVDNIFPHHEDEIAQSEGFTGQPFVNYWVHAQHLLADGQKMAKSTGNAYTCSEIEARGFDPMALRYFYTTALYRSRLNFTFRALQAAQTSLERLRDMAYALFLQAGGAHIFLEQADQSAVWGIGAINRPLHFTGRDGDADKSEMGAINRPLRSSGIDDGDVGAMGNEADKSAMGEILRFAQDDSPPQAPLRPLRDAARRWQEAFLAEVEDDMNMPRAMAVVWAMLRSDDLDPTTKVRLLLDMDRILGFDLKGYLQSDQPEKKRNPAVYLASLPREIATQVQQHQELRRRGDYSRADDIRRELETAGYNIRDTAQGPLVLPRPLEDEFTVLSSSTDAPDHTREPDAFEFSVNLLAHNSREDLDRCIQSICRHTDQRDIELVIVDNGSTDDTLAYLQQLARQGDLRGENGERIGLQVLFADHNMGFAAGRNATMRASRGRYIVLMDTSIEVKGDIWEPLARVLADRNIGVAGPYGLVTEDLREFHESTRPDVDAIEGYLMAFRRELLQEVGWIDERFRFYRLMDIHFSFFFKTSGYRVLTTPQVAERLEKHPHREWFSLSEDERATKSKKNYDIFRDRWHHGESLLVVNYKPHNLWRGHDHHHHLEGTHAHVPSELPPPGEMHIHTHQHWPDHSHEHSHYHESRGA